MDLGILSPADVFAMNWGHKAALLDRVVASLTSGIDDPLLEGVDATFAIHATGCVTRVIRVRIGDRRIRLAEDDVGQLAGSMTIDVDALLVHATTCQGYGVLGDLFESGAARVSGDENIARCLSMRWGVLPTPIDIGLARLGAQRHSLEVPETDAVDTELAGNLIRQKQPFIVRGGSGNWPAAKWTIQSLREQFGHLNYSSGKPRTLEEQLGRVERRLDHQRPVYISAAMPPQLLDDLAPVRVGPLEFRARESFLSSAGACASLHRDLIDGFAAVFLGAREFWLFAPSDAQYLYACPGKDADAQCSCVRDPRTPDLGRFPLFARATPARIVVDAADLLYVPAGWFHSVLTLRTSFIIKFVTDAMATWTPAATEPEAMRAAGGR